MFASLLYSIRIFLVLFYFPCVCWLITLITTCFAMEGSLNPPTKISCLLLAAARLGEMTGSHGVQQGPTLVVWVWVWWFSDFHTVFDRWMADFHGGTREWFGKQELCHRFSGSVCREGPTICKPLFEFDWKAWKLSESSSSCVQDVEPFTVRSAFVQLQICVAACSSVCHLWLCRNMSNVLAIFDG